MRSLLALAAWAGMAAAGLPATYPSIPMRGITGEVAMPLVGIGTWQYDSSFASRVVQTAFKHGYRHVDTALVYGNHLGVSEAIHGSSLNREEFFVTTKIPGGLNASAATAAAEQCLAELKLDYVDLMLIHFPASFEGKGGSELRKEQWLSLEKWAKAGKARALGVSHYCKSHLDDILSVNSVPVALNQVEYHVGMGSAGPDATDDKEYCQSRGIIYAAFSSLCGPCPAPGNTTLTKGRLVSEIGKAHGKSGAQVALRWAVQQNIPVIPKSGVPQHIKENFELFDFELTPEEMQRLTAARQPAVAGGGDGKTSGDCPIAADLIV